MNASDRNKFDLVSATTQEPGYDFQPTTFESYLGQEELKKKLSVYTQAARMRSEALDHLLLFGPPGVGKTTLATIMAHVMGVEIKVCSGPMLERTGDLVALLSSLGSRDILFIDEIHSMPSAVEEVLYTAMEQFRVDVIIGQGAGAQSVNLPLQPFTLVGATTKSGNISAPLRSRFGIIERIDFYTDQELAQIVLQQGDYLQISVEPEAALLIAAAGRGTPRIAKKLVKRVRDIMQVEKIKHADKVFVEKALQFLGIDSDGLHLIDNLLLKTLLERFKGGPAGVEALAALIGEDATSIEEVYEPFLLRKGFLERTPRGRQIARNALSYFVRKYSGQQSFGLF